MRLVLLQAIEESGGFLQYVFSSLIGEPSSKLALA
jgi:hypothetical protein